MADFQDEVNLRLIDNSKNKELSLSANAFMKSSTLPKYSYNFSWLGRPIIQYPQDIVGMQELIWKIKPDLIIETGIAHGGSLIFSASMLELLDLCDVKSKLDYPRMVLGIDVDIRKHNKIEIEKHPLSRRIRMIEGSSIDSSVIEEVNVIAKSYKSVLVCLDSNHTEDHVLEELNQYSGLVTVGSYCVVFDTIIEDLPNNTYPDRPWGIGNNPKTAVHKFLEQNKNFEIDRNMDNKLMISVAPNGYLRRIY
jgi:cephalosporin hydroxylase